MPRKPRLWQRSSDGSFSAPYRREQHKLGETPEEAEKAFHRLLAGADAILDAGCADEELLAHCRGGGEHVRGCWAVDLLLGKR
jgi:hypothetical protein